MSQDVELERVRAEAGACPRCGSSAAKPILRGYPMPDDFERLGVRVSFGGCCIPAEPAAYVCGACDQEYGRARFGDEEGGELEA